MRGRIVASATLRAVAAVRVPRRQLEGRRADQRREDRVVQLDELRRAKLPLLWP
jgi:hypothetical protein